jgi:hypothetical protein
MLLMSSMVRQCHQNVVNVAESVRHASQHLINHPLERLARIAWDLVISLLQVWQGKEVATLEAAS